MIICYTVPEIWHMTNVIVIFHLFVIFQKAVNLNVMVMWLLSDCKSWRGPVTSAVEILEVLKRNPDKQKFILRTELAYFTDTHKTEKIQRPDLFRQKEPKICTYKSKRYI